MIMYQVALQRPNLVLVEKPPSLRESAPSDLTDMQIFMRDVPPHCHRDDLLVRLAKFIHRPPFPQTLQPINFDIQIFPHKKGNKSRYSIGLLTLPTSAIGQTFLDTYGRNGIPMGTVNIKFSRNNKPDDMALIARTASKAWEDPEALRQKAERNAKYSTAIQLKKFAFGRLCRDGSFSIEDEVPGTATVHCDMNTRRVCLSLTTRDWDEEEDIETVAWYRFAHITALCSPETIMPPHNVFLEANSPPVFEKSPSIMSLDLYEQSIRQESIHRDSPMASVGRLVCLSFLKNGDLDFFLHCCKAAHIRRTLSATIPVVYRHIYSTENQQKCEKLLLQLPFPLAFEADRALAGGIIDTSELILLFHPLRKLRAEKKDEAAAIFRWFISNLPVPSLRTIHNLSLQDIQADLQASLLKKKKKTRRFRGQAGRSRMENLVAAFAAQILTDPTISDLLVLAAKVYAPERVRLHPLVTPTPAIYQSYHMVLTPSSRILEGPLPDQSSNLLRRFGNIHNFLRVTFQDDNRLTLRQDTTHNISIKPLLVSRYKRAMVQGIRLAGRKFEFLGYSMSGLKQHSVFFVSPFRWEGQIMNAESIRGTLGDFSRIQTKPALLAARYAQLFSATSPSITLASDEIRKIPDRKSSTGSLFTDGCSPVSSDICRAAAGKLRRTGTVHRDRLIPSCYQIRIGGAKGVIFEDPRLPPRTLTLRPSQTKFESNQPLTLDIASHSGHPIRMFLNRPLIMLLEHLGVRMKSFIDLQSDAIANVELIHTSFQESSKLFQQHGLGASYRLPSLFTNMVNELKLDNGDISKKVLGCDLINTTLEYAATQVLRELKFRARIPVPGSYTLIGVSDEWGCLREGEIFATIRDEKNNVHLKLEGTVLITRSPQIHPGDVQLVRAVRRPQLEHLNNVVVFSCRGLRSLPSCLGGGDLDGDIYNLIMNPTLFPTRTVDSGSYNRLPDKETQGACTIEDIADFVIDYIEADIVGMIANRHLCIADQDEKGPECAACLTLAEYASHAVDFPKTGTPVNFSSLPKAPTKLKPDFLSTELIITDSSSENKFYPSKKVLGHLFRRIPLESVDGVPELVSAPGFGSHISAAVTRLDRTARRFGLPSISGARLNETLLLEMGDLLDNYKEELGYIAKAHTLSKAVGDQLSEAELVSGTIQANWADHQKRRETIASMNLQTQLLTRAIRREFSRVPVVMSNEVFEDEDDDDENDSEDMLSNKDVESFARASAAWVVVEKDLADGETFGPASFGLVALGVMLDVVKKARRIMR